MRLFNFERNYNILKSKSPCILLNGLVCPKEFFLLLYVLYLSYWIHFQNIHTFIYPKTLLHTLFSFFLKSSKDFIVSLRPGSIKTYFRTFLEITLSKYYKAVTCWIICFKYYKIFLPCFFDVKRKLKSPSTKRSFGTFAGFLFFQWVFVFLDPRPSAPISSALIPQNIARTNLWIRHITYSRLYLFNTKILYLFEIFKNLFRNSKLWCPK